MKTIKGFEGEEIEVSDFGEWVGKDYIDYKFEYKNNQKVIKELFKENQELKKQLEDYKKWYQDELEDNAELSDLWINRRARAIELENQQKEFIEYLEKNINHYKEIIKLDRENNTESDCRRFEARWTTYEEILLKYKEIIKENFYKSRKTIKERIRK